MTNSCLMTAGCVSRIIVVCVFASVPMRWYLYLCVCVCVSELKRYYKCIKHTSISVKPLDIFDEVP